MSRFSLVVLAIAATVTSAFAQAKPTRFWNLTKFTISDFRLAPAGTTDWGPNQCKNDKDGNVDSDERLRITDVASGTYDAKFADAGGRVCVVHNLKIEVGSVFTIEEKDLKSCEQ